MDQEILHSVQSHAQELYDLSLKVWNYAEVGLQERNSWKVLADYLARHGFSIENPVGEMPTAFCARWGTKGPTIGFLGEYDALSGLSQKVASKREPLVEGAPGHGCGHNLLGVGSLGAALALKEYLESKNIEGTVVYYGCPAEETLIGKVFMARDGLFNNLDAAITWHPTDLNTVQMGSSNGVNSAKFRFYGKTAHAAGDPYNGRSALDAVELMNVGANYLREHVIPDARIHYVITNGGGQPNVVPADAEVWYFVRAPRRRQVEEIYERLQDVAKGAAIMTGTTFEVRLLAGCYDFLPNETLATLALDCLKEVGAPAFSDEEMAFAKAIADTIDKDHKTATLKTMNAPEELFSQVMNTTIVDPLDKGKVLPSSTDVGDVSWITPTVQLNVAAWPIGTPGHSWQVAACSGHSLGQKSVLTAAQAMALTGLRLIADPSLIRKAREEFQKKVDGEEYKCPIPKGQKPPFDQF